jgi:bacteriorhodopsin
MAKPDNPAHFVRRSTLTSIAVQLVTGLVLLAALLSGRGDPFLRSLAALEASVQTVELAFYMYIVRTLTSHESVRTMAAKRYADWVLTTPVMLITLAGFFAYDRGQASSLGAFLRDSRQRLGLMVGANLLMLLAGVLGEVGAIGMPSATAAGFAAYLAAFAVLHGFLGPESSATARALFWVVASVWAVYGVLYLLPPHAKNNGYNYLDLVAKNFFGLFLSLRLLRGAKKANA